MLFERNNASVMVTIAVVALILAVVPTFITSDIDVAFAHSCHNGDHDHDDSDNDNDGNDNSNKAEQEISQAQSSAQNSQVVSGEDSIGSGNNVGLFFNDNIGNLALGQQ
ncbi:MAG: hypothetical protein L0H53_14460 [Candidatus Nitrosocosmicus sp.]|nr:hypothetical protein [Candidatus Nitrosocosmicus sp.]MDN5868699.1 hypothetical protein [Candidatus Nitrosocosmicus sp.]